MHALTTTPKTDWRRTHTCGELRAQQVGTRVTLNGWVHARRDHGGVYFVDLRDRYGITQVVLGPELADAVKLGPEFTISVSGKVVAREPHNVNPNRPTGEIDVVADRLEILSRSNTPPFPIDAEEDVAFETRLKYRYLDLRRPAMQRNFIHRSRFIHAMRRAFERQNFLEVETPILTKATPEGARDFLVPSRVHPGEFYALPQSPQLFKQILMVAGMDRYYQVARCFRDEDLRADRQLEFTQLDMEMSFVEEDDIFRIWEQVLHETFRDAMGIEVAIPFPRMSWKDAMERFGVDKPDLRFGLELVCVGEWAKTSEFAVFKDTLARGERVMGLRVPAQYPLTRKEIDALEEQAKAAGAKGLAWWKLAAPAAGQPGGGGSGPLSKFTSGDAGTRLRARMQAVDGDTCLFVAGKQHLTWRVLGDLRNTLGKKFGLAQGEWRFTWVTSFPMFEFDEQEQRWFSSHHPFTAPVDWSMGGEKPDLSTLVSRAYDLVLNGWELGSGSVRIHRTDVQQKVFAILGIGPEEQKKKFGFLLEALSFGAPPHAGFAIGLDRLCALSLGMDNIRDIVAFPKTASASCLMTDAPSTVAPEQLAEVHVRSVLPPASRPPA